MRYDAIFFDADETLLDFRKSERHALEETFARYGIPCGSALLEHYHEINKGFWDRFERGEVSQEELRFRRFEVLFRELGISLDGNEFNNAYSDALSRCSFLLQGALELVKALFPYYPLYIVTNGTAHSQHGRVEGSALAPYLSGLFISQELGAKKPDPLFFNRVFEKIGGSFSTASIETRKRFLLLGDSLTADMRGGRESGLTTCWYCPAEKNSAPHPDCDYIITSLEAFPAIALAP